MTIVAEQDSVEVTSGVGRGAGSATRDAFNPQATGRAGEDSGAKANPYPFPPPLLPPAKSGRKVSSHFGGLAPPPYFHGLSVAQRHNEDVEILLKRFKRLTQRSGMLRELRRRRFFIPKSEKRAEKKRRRLARANTEEMT
ncbi:30S ribosomal protein S21 [bacterium]|nr:30S ribosomal protein S21 [bacterium]